MWVSFTIIFGYLCFVLVKFGIPRSISETYYLLGSKGWLFQLALGLTAFTAIPMLIDRSSVYTQFLAFLACGGLGFVAAAPMFRLDLEGKVHYVSAYICCGSLVLWQIFNASWVVPFACFAIALVLMLRDRKYMWWIEIAAIVSTYVSLMVC